MDNVTRVFTRRLVTSGELTDNGEWHVVDLNDLIAQGWQFIEFHYPDEPDADPAPNQVRLLKPED